METKQKTNTVAINFIMNNLKVLDEEVVKVKERYKTLSELWMPKSKHATHIQIAKMMDEALTKLTSLEKTIKIIKETLG